MMPASNKNPKIALYHLTMIIYTNGLKRRKKTSFHTVIRDTGYLPGAFPS